MAAASTSLEIASTGVKFEQLRASYWQMYDQPTKADEARRELAKWKLKHQAAWLSTTEEVALQPAKAITTSLFR